MAFPPALDSGELHLREGVLDDTTLANSQDATRVQYAPDNRKIPPEPYRPHDDITGTDTPDQSDLFVTAIGAAQHTLASSDGSVMHGILVGFTPPNWWGPASRYDVYAADESDLPADCFIRVGSIPADRIGKGQDHWVYHPFLIRGRTYTIAVVPVNADGAGIEAEAAPQVTGVALTGEGQLPPDVTGFDAQPDCDVLFLWVPVTIARNDVAYYEIRQGANFAAGTLVIRVWGWKSDRARVPALSLPLPVGANPTFHIKAFTRLGAESATEDSDTLTAIQLICLGLCLPPGYVSGAGVTFLNIDEVTVGSASFESHVRDSTDEHDIRWTAALSANITVSGAGGLDVGVEAADLWYAVHVIGDSTCVVAADALLSLSATAPTLPAGFDVFRRVGWVRNNGSSAFLRFTQTCDGPVRHYEYDEARTALQVLAGGNAILFATVSMVSLIPPDSRDALLAVSIDPQTVNDGLRLRPTGSAVLEANAVIRLTPGVTQQVDALPTRVTVGASQDIDYAVTSVATAADIYVVGFVDHI